MTKTVRTLVNSGQFKDEMPHAKFFVCENAHRNSERVLLADTAHIKYPGNNQVAFCYYV